MNFFFKAYLDTGSELNKLLKGASDALKLKLMPTNTVLKGFNGDTVRALGEVQFELSIDEVHVKTSAVVTNVDLGDISLIIGQTVVNQNDITLKVFQCGAHLSRATTTPNNLYNIDLCDDTSYYRVKLVEDTSVPIGDNLVQFTIRDADCGDYCTRPRQFRMR